MRTKNGELLSIKLATILIGRDDRASAWPSDLHPGRAVDREPVGDPLTIIVMHKDRETSDLIRGFIAWFEVDKLFFADSERQVEIELL